MRIADLQKTSFIDYPGKLAAIVFTQGCNFRCPYCHNPELVDPAQWREVLALEAVFDFLKRRRGKLEALVITGGEPSLQPGLTEFIENVKRLDYLVKLDTNGTNPELLKSLIAGHLVDYVAMDIKAPLDKYELVTHCGVDVAAIAASIDLLLGAQVPYEFRTTLVEGLLDFGDVLAIARRIQGARLYALQNFRLSKHVDQNYSRAQGFAQPQLERLGREVGGLVSQLVVR